MLVWCFILLLLLPIPLHEVFAKKSKKPVSIWMGLQKNGSQVAAGLRRVVDLRFESLFKKDLEAAFADVVKVAQVGHEGDPVIVVVVAGGACWNTGCVDLDRI